MRKYHVASLSCGKDSLAMVLKIMELGYPLDYVIMYDTGMEFKAIYRILKEVKLLIEDYGAELVIIKPENDFLYDMLLRPVCAGTDKEHYGYDWCGGCTRWRTSHKVSQINAFLKSLGDYVQYVGIAFDEPERVKYENNKTYPLVEWEMTESDCLKYCYDKGFNWNEETTATESGYIDLYSILDRVSCWCCKNKNLKELKNIYIYLPDYWTKLKALQSRISRPFKGKNTIFDLEERFYWELRQEVFYPDIENCQMNINDFIDD